MLKRILYSTHRVLGTILSILFLLWFLTGMVMMYHDFPSVKSKEIYQSTTIINEETPSICAVFEKIPSKEPISQLLLSGRLSQPVFSIRQADKNYFVDCELKLKAAEIPFSEIEDYAKRWSSASIVRVDSLYELQQWIPFSALRDHFPIYKFHFADKEKHQLYVSSKTGAALQFTNKTERFWSWIGPIPHWIYPTILRQNRELWINVVIVLSAPGVLMCLFGIIVGIFGFIKKYKKTKRIGSPYGKWDYKWHHILGFFFGIFVFTFIFSGMMSVVKVPQWIVKTHNSSKRAWLYAKNENIKIEDFKSDYKAFFELYPNGVKSIEWSYWADVPIYKVVIGDSLLIFDASHEQISPFILNKKTIEKKFAAQYNEKFKISELNEYDNYYVGRKQNAALPLPVYKIEVENKDNSLYYLNPQTGASRYLNSNDKARKWSYNALHSYSFGFFSNKNGLWYVFMWIILIGGTVVSFTGLTLSYKFLKRKAAERKKKRRKRKKS